jgi:hypothetical protein
MTRQRVLWTACPHGKAKDGKLRVSVHVAPQLFPTGNAVSTLAEFSDWQYWPATNVSFKVKIGPRTFDADIVSAPPSSSLWHVLFPSSTTVDPYEYQSPTSSPLFSYPAGFVRHFFQSTYAALANTAPVGNWPGLPASDERGQFRRPAPRQPRALRPGRECEGDVPERGRPDPAGEGTGPGVGPHPGVPVPPAAHHAGEGSELLHHAACSGPAVRLPPSSLTPGAPPCPAAPFRARLRARARAPERALRVPSQCRCSQAGSR